MESMVTSSVRFQNNFSDKKVLITGNTGFKGSWLTAWLLKLGANVYGISKDIPTQPSLFETLKLKSQINHTFLDIRNLDGLSKELETINPDFVFHLAAQPIVSQSYDNPLETITTNVVGTANVLESLRKINHKCVAVIITSDKCYENLEWVWGYKETDRLGGKDMYSASKGAAEIIYHSYYRAFFDQKKENLFTATARAGNVIGGGDWARDRIVPDCIRAWSENEQVTIRQPLATRPWQHVLEPLSGYLQLASRLWESKSLNGESFNFGPSPESNATVKQLISDLGIKWGISNEKDLFRVIGEVAFSEAGLLKLNCDKALAHLQWRPTLTYDELVDFTGNWYKAFHEDRLDMQNFTTQQIDQFEKIAAKRNIKWAIK